MASSPPVVGERLFRILPWGFVLLGGFALLGLAQGLQLLESNFPPGKAFWRTAVLLWPSLLILPLCWGVLVRQRLRRQLEATDSARKKAEQETVRRWEIEQDLREREICLSSLLAEMKDYAYFTISPEGGILSWNQTAERLYGYPSSEMQGRSLARLCREEDRAAGGLARYLRQPLAQGKFEDHCWLVRGNGAPFWAHLTITPLGSPEGKLYRLLVMTQDLTDQRKVEDSLRRSRIQYRNLTETARDLVVTVSPDGVITSLNPAFEAITGWPRQLWLSQPFASLLVAEDRSRAQATMQALLKGETPPLVELRIPSATGKLVMVEFTASPHPEQGQRAGWLGIGRDVSERKQAEEALRLAQEQLRQTSKMKAIGQLAGGVAHDFNNLLTIINGYSETLLAKLPAGAATRGLVGEIQKAGERAATLTRQLLAFSRKQVLTPRVLDLNPRLADLTKMLQRLIGEDVELVTDPDPSLCLVKVDPGQIDQVLMNLAVNARDAMPRGGRLTIQTCNTFLDEAALLTVADVRPGPYVLLRVSDTGCGMDQEVLSHLFEPFFTTKEPGKGTGLGLATVYGIVKQSGGHIEVESEVGRGSTFRVYLPQPEEVPAPLPRDLDQRTLRAGGKETVLLVEDEEGVRKLTQQTLAEKGYTLLTACDGQEALALFEKHPGKIDLVITDVVMPQMSGAALVQALREKHFDLKALFISGYNDSVLARHGVVQTERCYLNKPFTLAELVYRVRQILDGTKAQ